MPVPDAALHPVIEAVVAAAVYYVVLLFVFVVFQRFADVAIPSMRKLVWQVAVMAVCATAVSYLPAVGEIAAWAVLLLFMRLWYDATIWSVFIVWMASRLIQFLIVFFLLLPALLR